VLLCLLPLPCHVLTCVQPMARFWCPPQSRIQRCSGRVWRQACRQSWWPKWGRLCPRWGWYCAGHSQTELIKIEVSSSCKNFAHSTARDMSCCTGSTASRVLPLCRMAQVDHAIPSAFGGLGLYICLSCTRCIQCLRGCRPWPLQGRPMSRWPLGVTCWVPCTSEHVTGRRGL
jgi:hypothetical protein